MGVATLLVLPDALELVGNHPDLLGAAMATGFMRFFTGEKLLPLRSPNGAHDRQAVGILGAASLAAHSFLDGLGVGLALSAGTRLAAMLLLATA